ncbi:MAG: type IV secretory system conjugative DNA transfer family protein [Bacilli bacterium]|nr:type IV secretory system conjugative DNA transfer family protein [Bacilli bacterium]
MKLKFRADSKDWIIFGVFAIFVLYFSALVVLNLSSFASTGNFHGLNPFPAFSEEYFAPTMVVFIGILIALISSVSSHFFEREKGVGFSSAAKKEKGYARWATDKEMKKELIKIDPYAEHNDAGGIPIIMNKKGVWVDNGGYHNLIIGSTGAGKTQTTVFPMVKNLSKHDESMIITDPKGEIYEETAEMLKERGYNIVLLNFRDPQQGRSWNPLTLPYQLYKEGNTDKATEILDDLALNILYDESSKNQDPFWEKTSADYFAGLSQALFEDATEEQINLNSINLMTTVGEDKFMGTTYMKEYFSYKDPTSAAYINVSSTINAPNETKGSILSVFRQKIKLFATRDNLSEMLSHSDFDMKDIGRKKTAVFIVIQDEKKTYHSLVTIFLKQCYETLISVAQESGGKLPHRTNFILDEFANMPPLKDVTTMVTAARSRNIRFNFIIQNFAQLYDVYGKENGETIKGNCGNIVYLISSELSALEEISKMCGEVKSGEKDKTASTPLVTVSDLQRLKMWDIIVLRIRMMPFKTTLTPNFEMDWGKQYPKASYPKREKTVVQIFNLKKVVEEKKEAKMRELLGSSMPPMGGMNNPFGNGMPSMPPMGNMPNSNANHSMPPQGMGMPPMPEMLSGLLPKSEPTAPTPNASPALNAMPAKDASGGFNVDDLIKRIDAKIAELEEEEKQEQLKKEQEKKEQEKKAVAVQPVPVKAPVEVEEKQISAEPTVMPSIVPNNESIIQKQTVPVIPKMEVPKVTPIETKPAMDTPIVPIIKEEKPVVIESPVKTPIVEKPVVEAPVVPMPSILPKKEEPVISIDKAEKVEAIDDYITDDQFFDDFFNEEDD